MPSERTGADCTSASTDFDFDHQSRGKMMTRLWPLLAAALIMTLPVQFALGHHGDSSSNNPTQVIITTAEVAYDGALPDLITIKGTFFGTAAGTVFLGDQLLNVLSWADSQIVAELPANTAAKTYLLMVVRGR
jgi:IPT/TIG domain